MELILIPVAGLRSWLDENQSKIASVQLGTQRGVMKDGTRFTYCVAERDWLERLRGQRFKNYRATRGVRLNTHQVSCLQAMLQS